MLLVLSVLQVTKETTFVSSSSSYAVNWTYQPIPGFFCCFIFLPFSPSTYPLRKNCTCFSKLSSKIEMRSSPVPKFYGFHRNAWTREEKIRGDKWHFLVLPLTRSINKAMCQHAICAFGKHQNYCKPQKGFTRPVGLPFIKKIISILLIAVGFFFCCSCLFKCSYLLGSNFIFFFPKNLK